MINTLTKLQRVGISYLLNEYAQHISRDVYKGGKIYFINNYLGNFTNMFVRITGEREPIITMTFEMKEEINDRITYEFIYDDKNLIFQIIEMGEPS